MIRGRIALFSARGWRSIVVVVNEIAIPCEGSNMRSLGRLVMMLAGIIPVVSVAQEKAPKSDIRIRVLDAATKSPIKEFRIIAGIPGGSASDEFEKRTGTSVVNWQPHTLRVGKNGEYVWPADRGYDDMAFRIESDGYQPARAWAKRGDRPDGLTFLLVADRGITCRALRPDGGSAAKASVALVIGHRNAYLRDGVISGADKPLPKDPVERWRLPMIITADENGRFTVPTESEPAAVLIVHDSGVRELTYESLHSSPEVKLNHWGRVEGQVLWGDRVGRDEPMSLSSYRDQYGYPGMISSHATVKTDADGHFVFDKILPGHAQLSRPIKVGDMSVNLDGFLHHIDVKSGGTTPAQIGGRGRKVTLKLTGREAWGNVTAGIQLNPPRFNDEAGQKAYREVANGPLARIYLRDKIAVKADGTLTIETMLPGRYHLTLTAAGEPGALGSVPIEIAAETPGQEPRPLDLGELRVNAAPGKE
jgi:hypothetical protein